MSNTWIIGIIVAAAVLLLIFLIKKNQKDKKQFEKDSIASEIKPHQHDEEHT